MVEKKYDGILAMKDEAFGWNNKNPWTKIRAEVDEGKEMAGRTLKFPSIKKCLKYETGGISCYQCCLELHLCSVILVITLENNFGEVYAMLGTIMKSTVH